TGVPEEHTGEVAARPGIEPGVVGAREGVVEGEETGRVTVGVEIDIELAEVGAGFQLVAADELRDVTREVLRTIRDPRCVTRTEGAKRLECKARIFERLDVLQEA